MGRRFRFRAVRMGTLVMAVVLLGAGVHSILTLARLCCKLDQTSKLIT